VLAGELTEEQGEMPIDFTFLEPDGLQVHIKLNSMLSKRGFFRGMSKEDKDAFDKEFEELISLYLPYTDETHSKPVSDNGD
jgi:hypothetical protein